MSHLSRCISVTVEWISRAKPLNCKAARHLGFMSPIVKTSTKKYSAHESLCTGKV